MGGPSNGKGAVNLFVLSQSSSGLGGRSGDFAKWIPPLTFEY